MTDRICPWCKKTFAGHKNKRFCKRSHNVMWHRAEARKITNGRKKCNVCHKRKSISQFSIRTESNDGHQHTCKSCRIQIQRNRRAQIMPVSAPKETPKQHVCTPACTARFGFCVTLRNIQRRKEFAKYGSPIFCKSGRVAKQASFARAK